MKFNCSRTKSKSRANGQRGAAFVEVAIALPLLLTALVGVFDIGRWMTTHYTASRIAFESSRYAISLPELEANNAFSFDINSSGGITEPGADPLTPTQRMIAARMAQVVLRQRTVNYDGFPITVSGERVFKNTGTDEDNVVNISVEIPYQAAFPLVSKFVRNVRASIRGSYLL